MRININELLGSVSVSLHPRFQHRHCNACLTQRTEHIIMAAQPSNDYKQQPSLASDRC